MGFGENQGSAGGNPAGCKFTEALLHSEPVNGEEVRSVGGDRVVAVGLRDNDAIFVTQPKGQERKRQIKIKLLREG